MLALLALASCTPDQTPRPTATATGPPEIQQDAIEAHAQQFDEELPDRLAGSQQEFAAATYITAHLQQAGYVVEFDSIPVENTVRSTNVVALPPSTEDPEYLVAVAFDNNGGGGGAASVAVFLELTRALRAAVPDHSVQFVALGADATSLDGGRLGSRRMIKLLQDRDLDPRVIYIRDVARSSGYFSAQGVDADELRTLADARAPREVGTQGSAFEEAGFAFTTVSGITDEVATVLLRFLAAEGAR